MDEATSLMPVKLEQGWRALGLWQDVSLAAALSHTARDCPDAPLHFFGAGGEQVTTLGEVHAAGLKLAGIGRAKLISLARIDARLPIQHKATKTRSTVEVSILFIERRIRSA